MSDWTPIWQILAYAGPDVYGKMIPEEVKRSIRQEFENQGVFTKKPHGNCAGSYDDFRLMSCIHLLTRAASMGLKLSQNVCSGTLLCAVCLMHEAVDHLASLLTFCFLQEAHLSCSLSAFCTLCWTLC